MTMKSTLQQEIEKYIIWQITHKYGICAKKYGNDVTLNSIETQELFNKVGRKFKLPEYEVERQIRGLCYYPDCKLHLDGNFGLFNLSYYINH